MDSRALVLVLACSMLLACSEKRTSSPPAPGDGDGLAEPGPSEPAPAPGEKEAPEIDPAARGGPNPPRDSRPVIDPDDPDDVPLPPEELFSEATLERIETVLDDYPNLRSVGDMAATEGYMAWRRENLPEFQWDSEMNGALQEGLQMIALAEGIENFGDPRVGRMQVDLRFDDDTLHRAVGYVIEKDLQGYRKEIRRAVDRSIQQSLDRSTDDPPIRFIPSGL